MSTIPALPGITSKMIDTPRIKMHALFSGPESGTPVLFIHGNAASATFWEEVIADTGHTPYVEKPDEFMALLVNHLHNAKG